MRPTSRTSSSSGLLKDSGIAAVKKGDLGQEPRVVQQIEAQLGGPYDHYQPARHLLATPDLIEKLDGHTLDRFEKLFEKLNGLLS